MSCKVVRDRILQSWFTEESFDAVSLCRKKQKITDIAVLSIVLLSWADTSASVFGRKFGKYTFKLPSPPFAARKSLAGTIGAFVVGGLSAWIFYNYAAPLGSENDLSWAGPGLVRSSTPPALLQRLQQGSKWFGASTGFPEWLDVGHGRKVTTRFPAPKSTMPFWKFQLVCATAAAIAEGIDVYGLDDNVILPVVSGVFIWASLHLIG